FHPDPPMRAFYLASAGSGGPVNLVLLGVSQYAHVQATLFWRDTLHCSARCVGFGKAAARPGSVGGGGPVNLVPLGSGSFRHRHVYVHSSNPMGAWQSALYRQQIQSWPYVVIRWWR